MWGRLTLEQSALHKIIYSSSYYSYTDLRGFGDREKIVHVTGWLDALTLLRKDYGLGSEISIISDGTISYYGK